ncbi:MAG: hypothetical protein RIR00_1460 [Pseudomonadota bacterium]|jgi:thiamine pyrophosphate-dependent acetolactate synthase large subunit-like protein
MGWARFGGVVLAGAVMAMPLWADAYRWQDPVSGKVILSDQPPPRAARNVAKVESGDVPEDARSFTLRIAAKRHPVVLYTGAECITECQMARDLLKKRGVPFTEKPMQSQEDLNELRNLAGDAFVPSLKVGKEFCRGFIAATYQTLLDKAGYPSAVLPGERKALEEKK